MIDAVAGWCFCHRIHTDGNTCTCSNSGSVRCGSIFIISRATVTVTFDISAANVATDIVAITIRITIIDQPVACVCIAVVGRARGGVGGTGTDVVHNTVCIYILNGFNGIYRWIVMTFVIIGTCSGLRDLNLFLLGGL